MTQDSLTVLVDQKFRNLLSATKLTIIAIWQFIADSVQILRQTSSVVHLLGTPKNIFAIKLKKLRCQWSPGHRDKLI